MIDNKTTNHLSSIDVDVDYIDNHTTFNNEKNPYSQVGNKSSRFKTDETVEQEKLIVPMNNYNKTHELWSKK